VLLSYNVKLETGTIQAHPESSDRTIHVKKVAQSVTETVPHGANVTATSADQIAVIDVPPIEEDHHEEVRAAPAGHRTSGETNEEPVDGEIISGTHNAVRRPREAVSQSIRCSGLMHRVISMPKTMYESRMACSPARSRKWPIVRRKDFAWYSGMAV
jgi:hypothetical protein